MGKIPNEIKKFLMEGRLAYVGTCGKDGTPHVVPKGTMGILDDEHLVYADLYAGKTQKNLRENPVISVAVVNPAAYRGYQFTGTAEIIERGPIYDDLARRVETTWSNFPRAKYAVKIKVTKILDLSVGPTGGREIALE